MQAILLILLVPSWHGQPGQTSSRISGEIFNFGVAGAHLYYYVNEVLALLGAGDSTELGPALFFDTISAL